MLPQISADLTIIEQEDDAPTDSKRVHGKYKNLLLDGTACQSTYVGDKWHDPASKHIAFMTIEFLEGFGYNEKLA